VILMAQDPAYDLPTYTPTARRFHWLIAFLILLQFPIGIYMTYRGYEMDGGVNEKGEPVKGVWDAVTDTLYSSHKTIGIVILLLVLVRLIYRLTQGAPRSDRSVPPALTGLAHLLHWVIYALLIAVPIGGYLGISYGNYLDVFGVNLPAVTATDKDMSKELFEYHEAAAFTLLVLIGIHIAAAIYHRYVRRDRVVERMIPKRVA